MLLYLDDDLAQTLLVRLLQNEGHDVKTPADLGIAGNDDAMHLRQAIRNGRALLTGNYKDFELLHDLVIEAAGHHPGVLIVRRDNDPRRDLSPRGIVRALRNLLSAGVRIEDQCIILNHWR